MTNSNSTTGSFDKIRITETTDATVSSTDHGFQIGPTSGTNIIMDTNEVFARNNGALSGLHLNADGGSVTINNNLSDKVTFDSGGITATGDLTLTGGVGIPNNVSLSDAATINFNIDSGNTGTLTFGGSGDRTLVVGVTGE